MAKLFGTDGVRGTAGEYPLDLSTVHGIGRAMATRMASRLERPPRFVIGRDTRESGPWIEEAFAAGASAAGAVCESAGVITTPGVAYVARAFGHDLGVVISASHNPFEDNGIKAFQPSGSKIDATLEAAIEADVARLNEVSQSSDAFELTNGDAERFRRSYIDHLLDSAAGVTLSGLDLVLDCANGAASGIAPEVFTSLGASATVINDRPDGRNINLDCGSLHLESLQEVVVSSGADAGVAFDGDADRALFVDDKGRIVDGDATMWILAKAMSKAERLPSRTVVATVMSNLGLQLALESQGIEMLRTSVGDKYVLEALLESGSELGGEQSGHIIFPRESLVGDGIFTAIKLFSALAEGGERLSEVRVGFTIYPQTLLNVRVASKPAFESVPAIAAASERVEEELGSTGRLLLRYSGTENLARVMIEAEDQNKVDRLAAELADVIRRELGSEGRLA